MGGAWKVAREIFGMWGGGIRDCGGWRWLYRSAKFFWSRSVPPQCMYFSVSHLESKPKAYILCGNKIIHIYLLPLLLISSKLKRHQNRKQNEKLKWLRGQGRMNKELTVERPLSTKGLGWAERWGGISVPMLESNHRGGCKADPALSIQTPANSLLSPSFSKSAHRTVWFLFSTHSQESH
jgi:hypothetical protein